jgi:uncharacterized integral membrane protein
MLTLVITVLLGLGFALFATQNTTPVSIYVGSNTFADIPLYLVILLSILLPLLISGFIYLLRSLSSSLTLSEKEEDIKKTKQELAEITKQAHKLEIENTKLRAELGKGDEDEDAI